MTELGLKNFIKKQAGSWAIAAENFNTGQAFYYRHTSKVVTASIIKLGIAATIFDKIEKKLLSPTKQVKLTNKDKVIGTGVLRLFKNNPSISLFDTINLMITLSDNTATNMCLRVVKQKEVNDFLIHKNFKHTRLDDKYISQKFIDDVVFERKKHSFGHTTPWEMLIFLKKLFDHTLLKKESCKAILNMMRSQQADYRFTRFLPTVNNIMNNVEIIDFGSKTGEFSFPRMLGNVGFIKHKNLRTIGVTIFVEDIPISENLHFHIDHPSNKAIGKIVKFIYKILK